MGGDADFPAKSSEFPHAEGVEYPLPVGEGVGSRSGVSIVLCCGLNIHCRLGFTCPGYTLVVHGSRLKFSMVNFSSARIIIYLHSVVQNIHYSIQAWIFKLAVLALTHHLLLLILHGDPCAVNFTFYDAVQPPGFRGAVIYCFGDPIQTIY
jgi:hypothetical protein